MTRKMITSCCATCWSQLWAARQTCSAGCLQTAYTLRLLYKVPRHPVQPHVCQTMVIRLKASGSTCSAACLPCERQTPLAGPSLFLRTSSRQRRPPGSHPTPARYRCRVWLQHSCHKRRTTCTISIRVGQNHLALHLKVAALCGLAGASQRSQAKMLAWHYETQRVTWRCNLRCNSDSLLQEAGRSPSSAAWGRAGPQQSGWCGSAWMSTR